MRNLWNMTVLFGLSCMLFTACGDDNNESGTQPIADFAFKIKADLTVIFTNNSEDGESYSWDFGDGSTSTDESPTHKYAAKQSYTVKLTVTNGSKTDLATKTVDLINNTPPVDIDGSFTDWQGVTAEKVADLSGATNGIVKVKVTSDNNSIYFYAELIKSVASYYTIYMRLSNTTNIYHPDWLWSGAPIDAFTQFFDLDRSTWTYDESGNLGLKAYDREYTEWTGGTEILAPGLGLWEISGIKDIATKATFEGVQHDLVAIEIALKRSLIPSQVAIAGETIGLGFYLQQPYLSPTGDEQNWDNADAGWLPVIGASKLYTYNLTNKTLSE